MEQIVRQYSRAHLTYSSDRLPALSGIAARQQELTGDQYLAGLWRKSLITQLIWCPWGNKEYRPKWRAPTWSYMSIEGAVAQITWPSEWVQETYVNVVDVWTKPSGPDPCGAVTSGELTLSCSCLHRGHLMAEPGSSNEPTQVETNRGIYSISYDCLEDASVRGQGIVYLLPILESKDHVPEEDSETKEWDYGSVIHGLVLRACDVSKSRFVRVGSFEKRSSDRDGFYQPLKEGSDLMSESAQAEGSIETLSVFEHQDQQHIITIM